MGRILSPCRRQRARPVGLGGVGDQAELPAIFPLDVDAGSVSKRELARRLDPHVDAALAKLFVRGRPSIAASGLNLRITVSGMFEPLNHDRLIRSKHPVGCGDARGPQETAPAAHGRSGIPTPRARNTEARRPGGHRHRRRHALARGDVLPDLRREITLNDAIDFLHAVVPVTFCDAVLLDGATHDLVERARRQYPGVRMAATFSGRGDGIKRFLAHLASG